MGEDQKRELIGSCRKSCLHWQSFRLLILFSIILSFSSDVRFRKSRGPQYHDPGVDSGVLEIPLRPRPNRKPAWIVDGQQRVLALSRSKRKDLAVPVNALVALLEGGYAVERVADDGSSSLVGVELGIFQDGWVEVRADGLDEGDAVAVPS